MLHAGEGRQILFQFLDLGAKDELAVIEHLVDTRFDLRTEPGLLALQVEQVDLPAHDFGTGGTLCGG